MSNVTSNECASRAPAQATPEREPKREAPAAVPAVDIIETSEGWTVHADLPGVPPEALNVTVEDGLLKIEGRAAIEDVAGHRLSYREYASHVYRRSFRLPERVDAARIEARHVGGLLTLSLPKAAPAQRKVEVRAG